MIPVRVGGKRFGMSFQHEIFKDVIDGKVVQTLIPIGGRLMQGKTMCEVWEGEPGEHNLIGVGVAYCAEDDHFNKEIGRKISLTRVLGHLFKNNREIREAFWEAYHGRRG